MKRVNRDRLDGTEKRSWKKELFLAPGRLLLWIQYMNPQGGIRGVAISARHARSPIMTWLYSIGFWTALGLLAYGYFTGEFK